MHPFTEQKRGMSMAKVVEPNARKARTSDDSPKVPLHEVVSVEGPPVWLAEHEAMVCVLGAKKASNVILIGLDRSECFQHHCR
jgi:hypothetical protein